MKITLATLNGRGAVAGIEGGYFGDEFDVIGCPDSTPEDVCRAAAKALFLAARRFETLASMPEPLKADEQAAVNDLLESDLL